MTAQDERAAVCAWLRDQMEQALERKMPQFWSNPDTWQARVLGRHDALETALRSIEAGDHITPGGE